MGGVAPGRGFVQPFGRGEAQRRATEPARLWCLSSAARAWRPTVGPASPRGLGATHAPLLCAGVDVDTRTVWPSATIQRSEPEHFPHESLTSRTRSWYLQRQTSRSRTPARTTARSGSSASECSGIGWLSSVTPRAARIATGSVRGKPMIASKRSLPRSLGSDLAKVASHVIQPEE